MTEDAELPESEVAEILGKHKMKMKGSTKMKSLPF